MSALKQYIGDSVYADYDEAANAIVLTTENGFGPSNTIILDAGTLSGLACYQKWLEEQLLERANLAKASVVPPFEAANREEATKIAMERLQ